MIPHLARRLTPVILIGAAILVVTTPTIGRAPFAPTLTLTSGGAVGGVVSVTAAQDWATRTFNDPLDMGQRTDVSWWSFANDQPYSFMSMPAFQPCTTTGTSTDTLTRCMRATTESSNNPNFFLLETGGPAEPVLGRTGDSFPIDTSVYQRLTMRMRLGGANQGQLFPNIPASTMNFIWNDKTMYDSPFVTSDTTLVYGGWQIYFVDLPSLATTSCVYGSNPCVPVNPSPRWNASAVRTFRVNPIRINGVPIEIDWVRLTPPTVQTSTFSWTGASSSGVDIYLDNDTNMGNGNQGLLVQSNVVSTSTLGGNPTALRASSGSYTIPVGALAPGTYYVHACSTGGTSDCTMSSWRYKVNAPPTLTFLNPSPEGSNDDFATVQLNNAWDMTSLSDIDGQYFMTGLSATVVNATAEDGTPLGNVNVVRGTSLASGNTADPYMYPLWFAGDGRGRFKQIDSVKYHIATVEMGIPNKKRDLNGGSVARLVWYVDGDPAGENVSTDIPLNHTSGENTMAKFITSMKTLPLARPRPSDPNPSPSRSGWVGNISAFRIDPHEMTPATDFYVKRIKLASNEVSINNFYTVRWTYADTDGAGTTPTMTVSFDTDKNASNGLGGTICTVNPSTTSSCLWDTISRPQGSYYIYASYSDGTNTNTRYGDWPILVAGDVVDPASKPRLVLNRRRLDFGGKSVWPAAAITTAPQTVRLSITGAGASNVTWQAASSHPDVIVSPLSGTGDTDVTISMRSSNTYPANLVGDYSVSFSEVSAGATANSPQTIRVFFTMMANTATTAPFGSFDTPANGQTGVSGSIAVTGWALDDVGIDRVEIWRDLIGNDPAVPFIQAGHPANGKVFIANGTSVNGSRPDIEAAYPTMPANYRAGWGYLLLTWGFPNANGVFKLTAIAWDHEGRSTVLGSKTITVNNAAATKPFGSIDVPAYGATFSGYQYTFGWALTPSAGCTIAGGQVSMTIDSAPPLFPVTYGANRLDIASAFAGFSDSNSAGGAVALDSRNYSNGTHIIGWLVYDSCGNGEGIGSRFFTIQNAGSPGATPPPPPLATATTTFARLGTLAPARTAVAPPLSLVRGFSKRRTHVGTDRAGRRTVEVAPYDRIELHLAELALAPGRPARGYEAYQMLNGELRALPLGSSFDTKNGVFYWQPIPGFRGNFDLVFVRETGDTPVHVRVAVGNAGL